MQKCGNAEVQKRLPLNCGTEVWNYTAEDHKNAEVWK